MLKLDYVNNKKFSQKAFYVFSPYSLGLKLLQQLIRTHDAFIISSSALMDDVAVFE